MKVCDELVISNCGVPSGKLRKEIKTKVAWQEDMWDPASDSFYQVKTMVEEKVIKTVMELQGVSFTSFSFVIRFWALGAQMKFKIYPVRQLDLSLVIR